MAQTELEKIQSYEGILDSRVGFFIGYQSEIKEPVTDFAYGLVNDYEWVNSFKVIDDYLVVFHESGKSCEKMVVDIEVLKEDFYRQPKTEENKEVVQYVSNQLEKAVNNFEVLLSDIHEIESELSDYLEEQGGEYH